MIKYNPLMIGEELSSLTESEEESSEKESCPKGDRIAQLESRITSLESENNRLKIELNQFRKNAQIQQKYGIHLTYINL